LINFLHYSLKKINDEKEYMERELKYREFFFLPPYFDVFNIELSDRDLRKLAKKMREIYSEFGDILNIKKNYLVSRFKIRGFYKGTIQIHSDQEKMEKSGILKINGLRIKAIG